VELAFALEQVLVGGGSTEAYAESVGSAEPAHQIVREIETHVRAILRDVLCGYLDADLRSAADEILVVGGEAVEIQAHDMRRESTVDSRQSTVPEPESWFGPEPEPEVEPEPAQHELRFTRREPEPEHDTGELEVEEEQPEPVTGELPAADDDAGVTPSADWDLDEDPASYSAPI
jgi:hypothetical protein